MEIKALRKSLGLTQKQMADYTGIPLRTIQNWEEGRRKCSKYVLKLITYFFKGETNHE